jgi:two-component system, cell cycle sensor histidine kinase and response regulator CckA
VSLLSLLHRAETLVQPQIKHRVKMTVKPSDDVNVRCDPGRILQILINLLMNAAQAVTEAGVISLSCGKEKDWAFVEVEDNGTGIPREVAQHIFQPFFTTKPEGEGTGLGLSISQQIAVEHGGGLSFKSEVGKGTRFRLNLPVDKGETVRRPVVLLVDDDPAMLRALQRLLSQKFDVVIAETPDEASRLAAARKPDLILSDYAMPQQNGVSLVQSLREQGHVGKAMLVTSLQTTEIQEALRQGVIEVVMRKPINPTALMSNALMLVATE